ncbi:hypothetical protein V2J09_009294 [Rumex salicifolius]
MMVDLKEEEQRMKSCTGCYTTTTPLWRGGPAGPKTLCNACGIKYHKKRRALLVLESGKTEKPKTKKKMSRCSSNSSSSSGGSGSDGEDKPSFRVPLKIKIGLNKFKGGAEFVGRKLEEEEQAAMLLMALSCGSVYG